MADEVKISNNRQKKMDTVSDLSDKFGKSKAVVFTNYQGLTHKQIEGLKKELKKAESEFVVAKNSLLERAVDGGLKLEDDHVLEGPTGTLFIYNDIVLPLKALAKLIKELNLPSVKFGIMDDAFITGEQVIKLSTLPTKDVLLAQLVFGLKSPISGLHRALSWNLQKLVMTLDAVAKAKPADATPAAPAEPAAPDTQQPAEQAPAQEAAAANEPEPETISEETPEEKAAEQPNPIAQPASGGPANPAPVEENNEDKNGEKSEGGEN